MHFFKLIECQAFSTNSIKKLQLPLLGLINIRTYKIKRLKTDNVNTPISKGQQLHMKWSSLKFEIQYLMELYKKIFAHKISLN